MNALKYIIISFFFSFWFTPNFATIEVTQTTAVEKTAYHTFSERKPNFLEKIAFKFLIKKSLKAEKKDKPRRGDKMATQGLSTIVITAILSIFRGIFKSGVLYYLLGFAFLTGLIMCIIALIKGDLSKKGRQYAMWGTGIGLTLGISYFIYNFILALKLGLLVF